MVLVSGKTKQKTASDLPVWQIHGCIRSAYGIRKGITSLCKGNYCRLRICIHEITVSVHGCKLVSSSAYSGSVMAVIGQVSSSGSFFHEGCRYHTCNGSQPQTGFVGSRDGFVHPDQSVKNYQMCRAPKRLVIIGGARHLCCAFQQWEKYHQSLLRFFEKYDAGARIG